MSDLERHKWMAIGIRAKREAIERELAKLKCVEEYHAEQIRLLEQSPVSTDVRCPACGALLAVQQATMDGMYSVGKQLPAVRS